MKLFFKHKKVKVLAKGGRIKILYKKNGLKYFINNYELLLLQKVDLFYSYYYPSATENLNNLLSGYLDIEKNINRADLI